MRILVKNRIAKAVDGCRTCPLFEDATQGVFGGGSKTARLMMIGEQPGDEEDKTGRPFVDPSGRVLDETLEEVGIPRDEVWITNAVKKLQARDAGQAPAPRDAVEDRGAGVPVLAGGVDATRLRG